MDKQFLVDLTSELYRLTLLFPKKEPLRYKIREVADDILADLLMSSHPQKQGLFEVLNGFLEVALVQNWVKASEILAIKQKYDKVRELLAKEENQERGTKTSDLMVRSEQLDLMPVDNGQNQNCFFSQTLAQGWKRSEASSIERQKKILAFIKENGRAQVWQIKQIFPEISKRTLRRDFEIMFKKGILERVGERNNTFYQLKIS